MPIIARRLRRFEWLAAMAMLCCSPHTLAKEAAPAVKPDVVPASFSLQGPTLDGRSFNLAQSRGKVVMVMYWSTSCGVCLQKMPELRANAAGWRGKPFELVLVNTDPRRDDAALYARTVRLIEPSSAHLSMLWAGDVGYTDTLGGPAQRLPLTLVIDVNGVVTARHQGRLAPDVWDAVADLMP